MELKDFEVRKIVKVNRTAIPENVLKKIADLQDYDSASWTQTNAIYRLDTLKNILKYPANILNETTKSDLAKLVEIIETADADYVLFIVG